jgi:glutathione S-transferase
MIWIKAPGAWHGQGGGVTLRLYYVPKTRATRARWALEELGLPYELVRLDPSRGETKSPQHLARHPLGHVPVLETGRGPIFESVAICLHLAAGSPLLPADGTHERALVQQWVLFAVTELEPLLNRLANEKKKEPVDKARITHFVAKVTPPLGVVDAALATREWLVAERFTIADLVVGALLVWAHRLRLLGPFAGARALVERVRARPAFARAMAD